MSNDTKPELGLFAIFYNGETRPVAGFVLEQDAERYAEKHRDNASYEIKHVHVAPEPPSTKPETKGSGVEGTWDILVEEAVRLIHEAYTRVHQPDVQIEAEAGEDLPPLTPDKSIQLLRQVLQMLEAVTDVNGRMSTDSPLPKARVYLRGIIGRGIAPDVQAADVDALRAALVDMLDLWKRAQDLLPNA